jgi:hypothetical protein
MVSRLHCVGDAGYRRIKICGTLPESAS